MMNVTDSLRNIYDDISRWLTYAEAKHIALITIILFWNSQLINPDGVFLSISPIIKVTFCIINCIVLLLSISSFIPFLNQTKYMINLANHVYKTIVEKNILFYLYIFQLEYENKGKYEAELQCCFNITQFSDLDKAYIMQICNISKVTTIKNALFKIEVTFAIIIGLYWSLLCMIVA